MPFDHLICHNLCLEVNLVVSEFFILNIRFFQAFEYILAQINLMFAFGCYCVLYSFSQVMFSRIFYLQSFYELFFVLCRLSRKGVDFCIFLSYFLSFSVFILALSSFSSGLISFKSSANPLLSAAAIFDLVLYYSCIFVVKDTILQGKR